MQDWFREEDVPLWLDEGRLLRRADLIEDTMKELQAYGPKTLYSSIQYRLKVRSFIYEITFPALMEEEKMNILDLCDAVLRDGSHLESILETLYKSLAKIVKLVIKENNNLIEKFNKALKTRKEFRSVREEIQWSTARKRLHQLCCLGIHRNTEELRIFVQEFAQPMLDTMFELTAGLDKASVEEALKASNEPSLTGSSQSPTRKSMRETGGNETNEIPRVRSSLAALEGFCSAPFNSWKDYIDKAVEEDYEPIKITAPVLLKFLAARQHYNVVKKKGSLRGKNMNEIPPSARTYAARQRATADMVSRGPGALPKMVKTVEGDELMCMEERILWVHRSRQKWKADTAPIDAASLYPLVERQANSFRKALEASRVDEKCKIIRENVEPEDHYMFSRPTKLDFVDHVRLMCHPETTSTAALYGGNDIVDFAFNVAFTGRKQNDFLVVRSQFYADYKANKFSGTAMNGFFTNPKGPNGDRELTLNPFTAKAIGFPCCVQSHWSAAILCHPDFAAIKPESRPVSLSLMKETDRLPCILYLNTMGGLEPSHTTIRESLNALVPDILGRKFDQPFTADMFPVVRLGVTGQKSKFTCAYHTVLNMVRVADGMIKDAIYPTVGDLKDNLAGYADKIGLQNPNAESDALALREQLGWEARLFVKPTAPRTMIRDAARVRGSWPLEGRVGFSGRGAIVPSTYQISAGTLVERGYTTVPRSPPNFQSMVEDATRTVIKRLLERGGLNVFVKEACEGVLRSAMTTPQSTRQTAISAVGKTRKAKRDLPLRSSPRLTHKEDTPARELDRQTPPPRSGEATKKRIRPSESCKLAEPKKKRTDPAPEKVEPKKKRTDPALEKLGNLSFGKSQEDIMKRRPPMPDEGTAAWGDWSSKVRGIVVMVCPFCDKEKHVTEVGDFPNIHLVRCLPEKNSHNQWIVDDSCSQLHATGFRSSKRFQNMRDKVRKCRVDKDRAKSDMPALYENANRRQPQSLD